MVTDVTIAIETNHTHWRSNDKKSDEERSSPKRLKAKDIIEPNEGIEDTIANDLKGV